jgi:hypothetical protein
MEEGLDAPLLAASAEAAELQQSSGCRCSRRAVARSCTGQLELD